MDIVLGLDTIKELLNRLNNPHLQVPVIHVAGTNGKGSTIAMLSTALMEAGNRVGKYTSPAVFGELEMYQVNNSNISPDDYNSIYKLVLKAADTMAEAGLPRPTKFEMDTAIAYCYLAEAKCQVAIIETGMGGDLDATNVSDQVLASVITSISLDHTAFLGDSLREIAGHKAGIIKAGCPVIVSDQSDEVIQVIRDRANKLNAQCIVAGCDQIPAGVELSLQGSYQQKNAATVVATVKTLRQRGIDIPDSALIAALQETALPGRFETVCNKPLMIIDGAHNPGAVEELKRTLDDRYPDYKYIFIMGVLADKDYTTEIELIAHKAQYIITVTPDNPRALAGEKLAEAIGECTGRDDIVTAASMKDAVARSVDIYNSMDGDRLILAFGSLSYMAAVRREMELYADRK